MKSRNFLSLSKTLEKLIPNEVVISKLWTSIPRSLKMVNLLRVNKNKQPLNVGNFLTKSVNKRQKNKKIISDKGWVKSLPGLTKSTFIKKYMECIFLTLLSFFSTQNYPNNPGVDVSGNAAKMQADNEKMPVEWQRRFCVSQTTVNSHD